MTLLSVVRDVCAAVGVTLPQSVFSNITGNRTMQEMVSLANEMAQRIAYDSRDWTKLKTAATLTGDAAWTGVPLSSLPEDQVWVGGTTAFNLPANFKRMLLTSNVYKSTSADTPLLFVPDTDEWLRRRARNWTGTGGEWTMMGGNIHVYPVMRGIKPAIPPNIPAVSAETVYFSYIDKNCVKLTGGGFGDTFMNDLDEFRLDERLLKLAMIYQWKAQKGSSYAEDMSTYGDALAIAMGHDQPAPIYIDRKPISASISATYTGAVP